MTLALLLLACAPEPTGPAPDALPAHEQLLRASMALRGVRPSADELLSVHADPARLEALVRGYVLDPRFGETVRDLHAEQLLLRTDTQSKLPPVHDLEEFDRGHIASSLDEAPLRLVEHLVTTGAPYTDIVTTDLVLVDPVLSAAYGLPYTDGGAEWQVGTWTDGRPLAGLLSHDSVLQRHMSSDTNHHRGRANFVSAKLLCDDYTERPVELRPLLDDPYAAEERVVSDPTCASCHVTLDPLAGAFWGFRRYVLRAEVLDAYDAGCDGAHADDCYPIRMWDEALVDERVALGLPEPAYLDVPVWDVADLGAAVAADPRFASCTARRFYGWLTQTPLDEVPSAVVTELADVLVDSGWDARELAVAAVLHPSFASTGPDGVGLQQTRPEQLARTLEDLTGFRFLANPDAPACEAAWYGCQGTVDMLRSDNHGFHMLLGGIDGYDVLDPVHTSTPTHALTLSWVAAEAASYAIDREWSLPREERRLLTELDPGTTDPEAVRGQLAALHLAVLGELADPIDLGPTFTLYERALERGGEQHAWKVVLTALLQDPRLVTY